MWVKFRLFLMSLLVGAILVQTGTALVSSAQAATMEMMQAEVALNVAMEDCADIPGCDAPCHLSSQCRGAVGLVGPDWVPVPSRILVDAVPLSTAVIAHTAQRSGNDLQRPPEA